MVDVLRKLKEGKAVEVPIYNFVTHQRETATKTMYGANVIIFEGILVFHSQEILDMLDMKVFVDTDADIRLARRLKRYTHKIQHQSWLSFKLFYSQNNNGTIEQISWLSGT